MWRIASYFCCALLFLTGSASFAQPVFEGCAMTGDAKQSKVAALNQYKNRDTAPTVAQINPAITLPAVLAPGNDVARWSPNMGATIEGYVAESYVGGIETANCHAVDALHRDTHIALALSPAATEEAQTMIVEVTPRWRAIMTPRGADWSTDNLIAAICHRWVRITGWMLFDAEHAGQSVNTATGPRVWRATAWEIHPITFIEPLNRPPGPPCPPSGRSGRFSATRVHETE
jgi:hypothetical protein